MATVQIADIYNPLTFARRAQEAQIELNAFLSSGIMVNDVEIARQAGVGGTLGELVGFNPLPVGEPNYSTDNPAVSSTPANIAKQTMQFRNSHRNKSWSTMDLARDLALQDPMGAITNRIGQYWATDDEQRLLKSCVGLLADNVANDSGDMLKSVATDDAGAVTDAERVSAEVILDAKQTLGDHAGSLTAIGIPSVVMTRLQKQNLIDYIPDSQGVVNIPTYLGYRVIVDDSMPTVTGTNRITYTCILFGAGVFGYAPTPVQVPSEIEREASAGNGGGQDVVHSRIANIIQPMGFSCIGTPAGQSLTYAELATATTWNRVWDRKNIPLAFLQVND